MIGKRLGRWVIEKEIGRGGMGRVYLAHNGTDKDPVAIKILGEELAQDPGFLERFQREITVLSQLDHPNIVRFIEAGNEGGIYFYAMEYIEGSSMDTLLESRGRLPWGEVLELGKQLCPALKHAHDHGIIHRDIKPHNLLRTADGTVKLTDFGIAKLFASPQITQTGGVVGTAEFLSPEQALGKPASRRSDLYSLGVVFYLLLTGRTPFKGESSADLLHKHVYARFDRPQQWVPEIPFELDEVICQLLEKAPDKRPGDALVLLRMLERVERKMRRKIDQTDVPATHLATRVDNPKVRHRRKPGPATLMSRLVRDELEVEKRGSSLVQWLNRAVVLLPLFLLCISLIVWAFWPRRVPSAEEFFEKAKPLMESSNPADWDVAWKEYLEPLDRSYADHPYRREIEEYRLKIESRTSLKRALDGMKRKGLRSDGQRLYDRGLRLLQEGEVDQARQVWQDLVTAFEGVSSQADSVRLAEDGLARIQDTVGNQGADDTVLREAMKQAAELRGQGKAKEADRIVEAINRLYRDRTQNQAK